MERRLFRAWAWARWRCKVCDSTLGFSMKRRFLMAAVFAPIGGVFGYMSARGFHFQSQWMVLAVLLAFTIVATIAALKMEGIVVVEPRGVFCEGCGYNLTGNATGACPECGRAIPVGAEVAGASVPVAKPLSESDS